MSGCLVVFAFAPNIGVALVANAIITGALAMLLPGIFASLSLAIPPRARSIGFSVAALWIIPGLAVLPVIGAIGDRFGIRWGMVVMVPIFLVGGLVIASASKSVNADITHVWSAAAARSEALFERRQGRSKLLLVRNLDVAYGNVQVLFGVDFEVEEGRSSRCSAPTAPASRRCSRPSPARSRPTTARSSSTAATSPTPRRTRSPRSGSSRCPAARASSAT